MATGPGNDTFTGTAGNDLIFGYGGADLLYGGAGDDTLAGQTSLDMSDTLADSLYGGEGNDRLFGGRGDLLDGGAGVDTAVIRLGNLVQPLSLVLDAEAILRAGGSDALHLVNIERIDILGGAGDDTIIGGTRADTIRGDGGFDHLFGGGGDDVILVDGPRFEVRGGSGIDLLTLTAAALTGDLVASSNFISIGGVAQLVRGIERLTVEMTGHDATVTGGDYDDTVFVRGGHVQADGGAGNDHLVGDAGGTLRGGLGDDILFLTGSGLVDGGAGNDRLEAYWGSGGTLVLGGEGNDAITAYAGVEVQAGAGDDTVTAWIDFSGAGLSGGTGNDRAVIGLSLPSQAISQGLSLTAGGGDTWNIALGGAHVLLTGFEQIEMVATLFADTLNGRDGADVLYGDHVRQEEDMAGGGDDILRGWGGADDLHGQVGKDTLFGGQGEDTLFGGLGNDRLMGEEGNDRLVGGAGADTLYGGAGADRFDFLLASDSALGAADHILDFVRGEDLIDLSRIDADGTVPNQAQVNAAFSFIGSADFTGTRGQLRSFVSGDFTLLRADIDGDRVADVSIILHGVLRLSAEDFVL